MASTEKRSDSAARWRPFFEDLERRGILAQLLRFVDEQIAFEEREFRILARKTLITDAEKLADIHAVQGGMLALGRLRKRMRLFGERQKDPFSALRPVGADSA